MPDCAVLNAPGVLCSVGQPVELRYGLYAVDRNACLAFACAIAAHVLVAGVWPRATSRAPLPVPAEPEASSPKSEPVEVEIVLLAPSALPGSSPERALRAPGLAMGSSQEQEPSPRLRTHPASRAADRADDTAARPNATSPGGSLAMRGSPSRADLDPRAGSSLQAAIDNAASNVPGAAPRNDLLGGSPARPAERSPWRDSGNGTKRATGEPFEASIAADGTIRFRDRPNVQLHGLTGSFDVTDAVMAGLGEVLYPSRKLELMDQSREMRAAMAVRARGQALEASLASYPRRLHQLWRDSNYTLAQRKQLLFALWDECAESGDDKLLTTARSIRASTLAFIGEVLPVDAPGAYTETELAELNARRQSDAVFAPYRP